MKQAFGGEGGRDVAQTSILIFLRHRETGYLCACLFYAVVSGFLKRRCYGRKIKSF